MSDCKMKSSDCTHNHHNCSLASTNPSLTQTLDEMEFERGIWYAAQSGDIQRVEKLINDGTCVDSVDMAGYTALHYASRNGRYEVCKYLLEKGADVNAATRSGSATSLHRACSAGQTKIVSLLLQYKADTTVKDNDGKNALHRAAESKKREICELILTKNQAAKYQKDNRGKIPSDYCNDENLKNLLQ